MRNLTVMLLALAASNCAQMSYLSKEYGDARRDGEVTLAEGETYWVWINRSKPKLIISVSAERAGGMGLASGLTFGAVREQIPQPVYEDVARRWFIQSGRPQCKTTRGYPIDQVYFEFEYECGPAASSAPQRDRARGRQTSN